jgi:carbon monoxide dehydrogenase subunit G
MQMTAQQRISAPVQRVWDALHDADVLRRCIPGCQSLTKESEERMSALVSIKIGPIGARFTGNVVLSESEPPNAYTMTIEGQGGTVGFVKSRARVKLANDEGSGTLLSYDVDAQLGGRLVQLGGPIVDATAKQLVGKFFREFGSIVTDAGEAQRAGAGGLGVGDVGGAGAAGADARSAGATGIGGVGHATNSTPSLAHIAVGPSVATAYAPPSRGFPAAWVLAMVVAALVGYLIGHAPHGASTDSDWMGLAIGLLIVIVAAAGFEFGRRAAAPVVTLDAALLARLLGEAKR